MGRSSLHMLRWSEEHQWYELLMAGRHLQIFGQEESSLWQRWLVQQTSFAFQGHHGHMSVLRENRKRGAGYWYAYMTHHRQTRKRYLGTLTEVTFERLEKIAQALANDYSSARQVKQDEIPWLLSKQLPPQLPSALIERERLLHEMDASIRSRLVLLSAAAGSGKTTLLSCWMARISSEPGTRIWLSLDEMDDHFLRFWTLIISSIHAKLPTIGGVALRMLRSPEPPASSTLLVTLLNDLLCLEHELVLILDDYQVIENTDIHESLRFFLDHLPHSCHVMLSSRVDPPLPLARWRVQGQLVEIGDADLRFTLEEARHFVTLTLGSEPSQETLTRLTERTEGWIAGVQLAALTFRKHAALSAVNETFADHRRFIQEYIQEEILHHQSSTVQTFLLQIAILPRFNAALCQAVTGMETIQACQEQLAELERHHLFVLPLDTQRQWFRFHELFREGLLANLLMSRPLLPPLLHQRAARWYEKHGLIHEAMTHAFAALDFSFAASVLVRESRWLWMRGEAQTVATWMLEFPDDIFFTSRDMALLAALKRLDVAQNMPAPQWTEARIHSERIMMRLNQLLLSEQSEQLTTMERGSIQNRLCLLQGLIALRAAFQGQDIEHVRVLARQLQPLAAQEQACWKKIALFGLFLSAPIVGDIVFLLPDLLAVKQQALQEQDNATALVVMCWLAGAFLYGGHLHVLQQECLQVQAMLEHMGSQIAIAAYPTLDLAFLYYAWNQMDRAEICLQQAIQHAHHWQDTTVLLWSYSFAVRVFLAVGKRVEAERALQEIKRLTQETESRTFASEAMVAEVAIWLAQGNIAAAGTWATRFLSDSSPSDSVYAEAYLMLARVYLAQQQYVACLHFLTRLLATMEKMQRQWEIVQILALQVVALHACGEIIQARHVAMRLLTLTETEGYLRVYLDAGEHMYQVLQSFLDESEGGTLSLAAVAPASLSPIVAAFARGESRSSQPLSTPPSPVNHQEAVLPMRTSSELFEPLSSREQEVLHLLAEGASNQEIADQLVLSIATVKKHVGSLLLKLMAENRTHAVARARELSLL